MTFQDDLQEPLLSTQELKDEKDTAKPETSDLPVRLEFRKRGVWTIMTQVPISRSWVHPGKSFLGKYKEVHEGLPTLFRFLQECYDVAPYLMIVYVIVGILESMGDAVELYFSSLILNLVQDGVTSGNIDGPALIRAIALRVLFSVWRSMIGNFRTSIVDITSNRVRYLFDERIIRANVRLDLPTYKELEISDQINTTFGVSTRYTSAWTMLEALLGKVKLFTGIFSQIGALYSVLRAQQGGIWFGAICLMKAVYNTLDTAGGFVGFYDSVSFIWMSNPHYRRMKSLVGLLDWAEHRVEIISDGLSNYIQKEWIKARKLLGDLSDDYSGPGSEDRKPLWRIFLSSIVSDIPLLFYSIHAYFKPTSFSLPALTLIQQGSNSLTWNIQSIFRERDSVFQILRQVKELYAIEQFENKLKDGNLKYPEDVPESRGMGVTFEDVSFSYPGNTNINEVIKNVSFSIKPGQVVVIVGINGSGKSTLLKLFNRLYDPTSGKIYIDGISLTSFVSADVRRSMAMLYQTYSHYPLSIGENIALGHPEIAGLLNVDEDQEDNEKAQLKKTAVIENIAEAAKLGGSFDLIQEQKNKFDAVLEPSSHGWSTTSENLSQAFKDKMEEINKKADVSAGQWQRLALSRLFFRAQSDLVKLVAADEPSASLDPQMEYELFERLRNLSTTQGKTMIYVTHRFGYLTKHADQILVMQQGKLVEQGKHVDLVKQDGEYAKLYKLQAEAFTPAAEETEKAE
ncbi:hypothetical protein M422DRAFT_229166 [Sphaerobolus stellatus SS14]|uniref:ABC transporter domain-containing protein n=1 Tax=Sphaerobolus stellatus (strain SS14) TaxID=990650 RepID=A0A0C9UI76_SPHS4|nr:hypothetical protein M422DRAFT_229166 [Sphaerobolus stellatus SS14]